MIGEASKPIGFVRGFLGTDANLDPLIAAWLFLQSEFERMELANELAVAVAHLLEAWSEIVDCTMSLSALSWEISASMTWCNH